ncbi:MAG: glycosyltransferase [Candidatus Dojkabacteria bacterium]
MDKKGLCVFTYANPLRENHKAQLWRILETLGNLDLFEKVVLLTQRGPSQLKTEEIANNVLNHRFKILLEKKESGKTSFLAMMIRNSLWVTNIMKYVFLKKVSVVTFLGAIELITLPYFKIIKRSKVVYHADDMVTQNRGPKVITKIYSILERSFLKYCDKVVVNGPSIKQWYENEYNTEGVEVVLNATVRKEDVKKVEKNSLHDKLGIPSDEIIFGYVGSFTKGRSLEALVKIFPELKGKHLVLAGRDGEEEMVKEAARKFSNIHFIGSLRWDKIPEFTRSIDVGLVLLEKVSLNYYYNLPTKLFQYLASGRPVIVSDFPDMGNLIDKYDAGWKVEPQSDKVYSLIQGIELSEIRERQSRLERNRASFTWEGQESKVKEIYTGLLAK